MTWDKVLVDLLGLAAIAFVIWYFWLARDKGVRLAETSRGLQEADILVKGGYTPSVLVARAGRPVRLTFVRQEASPCSEMVVFPDFERSAALPTGQRVAVEFTPQRPGRYEFTCQMGMLRGQLVVE